MLKKLKEGLRASKGEFTEIRIEKERRNEVKYEGEKLKNIDSSEEIGGIVRTLVQGGWGIATFNSIDELSKKAKKAYRIGKEVASSMDERIELAEVQPQKEEVISEQKKDVREIPLEEKRDVVKDYNRTMLDHDGRIESTRAVYSDSFRELTYLNSEGTELYQEVPDVTLALVAIARGEKNNIQTAHDTIGEASGFELVLDRDEMAEEVASGAVSLLSAEPVDGGQYTVLLNPELAGVFIHEAFGHLCEADHFYKNDRLQDIMTLGRQFGPENLNVVDEGFIEGRRGNLPFDDEGVRRKKTYLIKDGKLNSFLHSRETAKKMGQEPTGNARAISYRHEPIVRMTNTYIEGGDKTFEELISSIDHGIFAKDAYGGQTQLEQFTFSAGHGRIIENGEIGPMVRDVVLTGNIFKSLENITGIGDDLDIIGSAGGCGKGGQMPLPVTDGAPHIRIEDVTIGGR
ncbi:TldD/PmbA family protein [Candidatus Bipolaricaulota bacterium]|nr:TldD/PmbA family protein [Candidatus Bipolaricaulota bacterium]